MPHPGGRPPKFSSPEELEAMTQEWWISVIATENIPDIEGWAVYLDTTRKTLFEYESKPEFSNTIKRWKDKIFAEKKQLALKGKLNPAIFIFDAINNTDYRNQTGVDHTTKGKELPTPILGGSVVSGNNSDSQNSKTDQEN